LAFSAALVDV